MYISEAVENTNGVSKNLNTKDIKKRSKKDKSVFVATQNKNDDSMEKQDKPNKELDNEINTVQESSVFLSSVFFQTEKINKKDIDEISNSLKLTMNLEQIQTRAIKLGISIYEGSTKSGKPKNKTKSELFEQIKEFIKNYKE